MKLLYLYTYISKKIRKGFQVWPSYAYCWFNICCFNISCTFSRFLYVSGFIYFSNKFINFRVVAVVECFLAIKNFTVISSGSGRYPVYCNKCYHEITKIAHRAVIYHSSFTQTDDPRLIDLKMIIQRYTIKCKIGVNERLKFAINAAKWIRVSWSFTKLSPVAYFEIYPRVVKLVPKLF